jgi:hypothetical protein
MENTGQKKSAAKVLKKKEKSEKEETKKEETKKEETKEQEKQSARLAERKGQRPAFPFNRKKL